MGTRRAPARAPRAPGRDRVARLRGLDVAARGRPRRASAPDHGLHRSLSSGAARGRPGRPRPVGVGALCRHLEQRQACRGGRRGHPVLRARGRRSRRGGGCARARRRAEGAAARGVHHHAAAREEPLADALAEPAPEGAGGDPRVAARADAHEAADPGALPERRRVRAGMLRGRGGGAPVFREVRGGRDSARGGAARGQPPEPAGLASGLDRPGLPGLRDAGSSGASSARTGSVGSSDGATSAADAEDRPGRAPERSDDGRQHLVGRVRPHGPAGPDDEPLVPDTRRARGARPGPRPPGAPHGGPWGRALPVPRTPSRA